MSGTLQSGFFWKYPLTGFSVKEATMARIPDAELEHLKAEVSVERLVEAAGIQLSKSNKDRLGKCPFHEDREASLVVTPGKNLWHCFGCGAAGGPIDWVMRMQGVSFRHAVELLRADLPLGAPAAPAKASSILQLPPPVAFDADDQALLRQVVDYYHATLKASPEAQGYLKARGIHDPEAIERFKLGYANRTLGYSLPIKAVKAGGEIRAQLARIGLYRESGHEHFTGSLVIPVLDEAGNVTEVYGRKTLDNLRKGTPYHLYLPGPHRGVWNLEGLTGSAEVILCEALIDALTFWVAGFRNVTAAYGVEGFTPDHLEAFQRLGVERVLIAYDRDEAGDRAAEKLAQQLLGKGIGCWRVQFPKGMDANAYALKVQPAAKSLGLVLRSAAWMGDGAPPEPRREAAAKVPEAAKEESLPEERPVQASPAPAPVPSLAAAPQAPSVLADGLVPEIQGQDLFLTLEDRRYRVRGWQKPLSPEVLRVNLMASRGERFHVDTLDLYQAKARAAFLRQAGIELGVSEERLKRDLGRVLRQLEALQEDQLAQALAARTQLPPLTEAEHAEALALLQAPDLLGRILQDFDALGMVGEASNKLTGYLAAVSRLLDRPLALLVQSASAAGKSSLMDAVLELVPEAEVIRYSAMSGQSLFYMGDRALKHKVLAIAEEEGARQASYALKILQSEGKVTMASTDKDPGSGMLLTLLHGWVQAECKGQGLDQADFRFTRRQAREALGWGDTQLWTHLSRLVEMEFLLPHRGHGKTIEYELLYREEEGRNRLQGLVGAAVMTEQIRGQGPAIRGEGADHSGVIRGVFGPDPGGFRGRMIATGANGGDGFDPMGAGEEGNRGTVLPLAAAPSYPKLAHANGHGR
jgi:DNA primase catalytic core